MRSLLFPAALMLALLLSPGPSHAVGEEEGEWARSYSAYLPGLEPVNEKGEKSVVSVRLVALGEDGFHQFVPHGTVSFHTEETHPVSTASRILANGKGDEFGFVNVFRAQEAGTLWNQGSHWHFEAPGRGAEHEFCGFAHFGEEEVVLPGGVDREIRVLDPFGRPLAGAKVSQYLGCPHSPVLRSGVTADRGIVRLANLPVDRDDQFWVEAPGIRFGPYELVGPWVGQGCMTIITDPARTARGIVVDEAGEPLPGVVVRTTGYPRGPVAVTGGDGGFLLHGIPWGQPVYFHRPDSPHDPRPDCIAFDFEEDLPLRVTLLGARPTSPTDGEIRHVVDVVAIQKEIWERDGEKVERWVGERGVPVVLSRVSDGFTLRGTTGEGAFRTLVPAGRYRVTAGGGFSWCKASSVEVDLPRPGAGAVRVPVAWEQVGLQIHYRDLAMEGGTLPEEPELRIPGRAKQLEYWRNTSLRVPPGAPAGLLVGPPTRLLTFLDGAVTLDSPPRNRIRFRLVDEGGNPLEPVEVQVDWDYLKPLELADGSWVVHTWACGRVHVSFGDMLFRGRRIAVDLPVEKAGLVDLGTVVLPGDEEDEDEGELQAIFLLFAAGNPVTEDDLHCCLIRVEDDWEDWEAAEIDEDGAFFVEKGRGPFPVRIEGPRLYPFATVVRPADQAEVRLPPGRISGELRGLEGEALPGVVYVDSTRYECPEGKIDVRGVPAGPHLVICGARDHVGEVRRIVLKEGEVRDLRVELTPR